MSRLNYHVCCSKCCVPLLCGPCFCDERDANGRITSVLEAETNKRIAELEAQNKQLLEACKYIVGCSAPMTPQQDECWIALRAAIASAEGVSK